MKSFLIIKKFVGPVGMKFGLINASFSSSEWQTVKLAFFAPWPGGPSVI